MQNFIPFTAARDIVLEHVGPIGTEIVALRDALGRILAEPIVSTEMIPPFDNSAMDGFAVRVRDVSDPGRAYQVAETIAAGGGLPAPLSERSCARIMTGAPLPDGADAVIPVEAAEFSEGRVSFRVIPSVGDNIRRAGENVRRGEQVLDAGVRVTPPVIGMLATLGRATVRASERPKVAVLATGDELVDASETPGPSQIRDANGPTLAAQIAMAGGVVEGPHRVGDDRERLRGAFAEAAATSDMLVISGGVSMGEYDYVRTVLEDVGFSPLFWKVRQRPGKPLLFGLIDGLPVFGLPGNPVSASVCFEQYVRPALAAMQASATPIPQLEPALLDETIRKTAGLHHFVRGRLRVEGDRLHVTSTGPQGSHISQSLVLADCLIHLPEATGDAARGSVVYIERMWKTL